jgi:hypothetical protein
VPGLDQGIRQKTVPVLQDVIGVIVIRKRYNLPREKSKKSFKFPNLTRISRSKKETFQIKSLMAKDSPGEFFDALG